MWWLVNAPYVVVVEMGKFKHSDGTYSHSFID
jgi:hypothetical protein